MASKKCLICSSSFSGRRDAKTCSVRCRKRLQLLKLAFGAPAKKSLAKTLSLLLLGMLGTLSLVFGLGSPRTSAAASSYLNFQARLLNSAGNVVPDGNYNIDFKIYDADSTTGTVGTCTSSCLWEETHKNSNSQGVRVVNGYLSVKLGEVTPFPNTINWDQQLWLTMNIGGTMTGASVTWDGEMQSSGHSIQLTAVPYAFKAGDSANLGGVAASDYARLSQDQTFTGQNSFKLDSDTAFQVQNTSDSAIFSVDTTSTGAGISVNGTAYISSNLTTGGAVYAANGFNINSTLNNYGGITKRTLVGSTGLNAYSVAILTDEGSGQVAVTTTTPRDTRVFGVAPSSNQSPGDYAAITIYGNTTVRADSGAVNIGDQLVASSSSGLATVDNSATTGIIGIATGSKASGTAGNVGIFVRPVGGQSTPIFRNTSDSPTAFQIQNANGDNLFNVDSTTGTVTVAQVLEVYQDFYANEHAIFESTDNSDLAFRIQNSGGADILFRGDTLNNRIIVGDGTATTGADSTLFVVDSASTSTLPAGVNGGMIYDSSVGKFKIFENGTWKVLCNQTDASCGGNSTTLQQAYTASTGGTTPEIKVDSTRGGLDIQDADTPTGGNLLSVRASNGSGLGNVLFGVSNTGVQIQNASGGSLLSVDSTNSNITINGNNSQALTWFTNSTNLSATREFHSTVTANGYMYAIGGYVNTVHYAKINANGSIGSWTATSTLPAALGDFSAVVGNGYIYVTGGSTDGTNGLTTVYYAKLNADGTLGSWQTNTASPLPAGRMLHTSAVANGYLYVIGGGATVTATNTTYYTKLNADGSTGTWSTTSNLTQVRRDHATTVADGYVYVLGGRDNTGQVSTVEYAKLNADGTLGSWSCQGVSGATSCNATPANANSMPAVRSAGSAVAMNGYLYYLGGKSGSSDSNTVYYAKLNADGTGATGAWSTDTNTIPVAGGAAFFGYSGAASNGYIYVVGGEQGGSGSNKIYYGTPGRTKIAGSLDLVGITGQDLLDSGSQAGSLTAGNTNILGSLNVRGASFFQQAVSVNDNLNVGGDVLLNSNNIGAVQAWQTGNSTNFLGRFSHATVTGDGYVYVIGGLNGSSVKAEVQYAKLQANGNVGDWATTTPLPDLRADASATFYNGYIYVTGGSNTTASTGVQDTVFYAKVNADGTISSWKTSANPINVAGSQKRWDHSTVAYNGYLYVIAGADDTNASKGTVYYSKLNADGSNGVWSSANSLGTVTYDASTAIANGYLYVIGGRSNSTTQYAKLNADGTLGSWNTSTALPAARTAAGTAVINGYIYVIGGSNNGSIYYANTFFAPLNADGSIGSWSCQGSVGDCTGTTPVNNTALPDTRYAFGYTALSSNGYLYVIGGGNPGANNTVYYTSTARVQINGSLDLVGGSGENLAEGGSGGELTAGNTHVIGNLDVQGMGNFKGGINVGDTLTVGGSALFKNGADSTTAFQIQNAGGGSLFQVDSTNSNVTILGNNTGEIQGWQQAANSLPDLRESAGPLIVNGYAYVIGGWNGTTRSTVYYAKLNADGSVGTWNTATNSLPSPRFNAGTFAANGYVYAVGGANDTGGAVYDTVYYAKLNADGSVGTWNTATNHLPSGRTDGYTVTANGYVYYIGGVDSGNNPSATVYYAKLNADGSTSGWTTSTNPLTQVRNEIGAAVANGYVYVIGGKNSSGTAQSTVYYAKLNADGSTSGWTTSTNPLTQVRNFPGIGVTNGYIYAIGGRNNSGTAQSTVYYAKLNADGSTSGWTTSINPLTQVRTDYNSAVTYNGYIYVMGGSNGSTTQSSVYYTSTSRLRVGASLDLVGATGENLVDGSAGGELTAGNTHIVGNLDVRGMSTFASGVSVAGALNVGGNVLLQNAADSTSALQIKNASGTTTLLNADTTNGKIQTGNIEAINAGAALTNSITTIDSTGTVGLYTATAMGLDGFPRISYTDSTNGDLKFAQCTNAACTTKNITTVDSTDNTGWDTSIVIGSDGFARISYYDATIGHLMFAQCTNADCSTHSINAIDTSVSDGDFSSIAMGSDGFARISYRDATNSDLKFAQCTSDSCASPTITTVDSTGDVGQYNSMSIGSDGFARISYYDGTNSDLKFAQCTNTACTTKNITTIDSTGSVGTYTSIAIGSDGFARISYDDGSNSDLKFAQCTNAACTIPTITTIDSTGNVGLFTSIAMGSDGFARISYYDSTNSSLKFAQCTNAACTTKNLNAIDSGGVGYYTSIALGSDGFARISYYDTANHDLKFAQLGSASGATGVTGSSIGSASAAYGQLYVKAIDAGTFSVSGSGVALFKNSSNSATAFQIQNAAGTTILGINTTSGILFSNIPDGATAVGFTLNVSNTYSTAGAKLISIQNNGVEKFAIDKNGHIITGGTTPSATVNVRAGTGASCTISGNDASGIITLVTGTSPAGGGGSECTITFATAYGAIPHVLLSPDTGGTAQLDPFANSISTTQFVLNTAVNISASTTYTVEYYVVQ